MSKFYSKSTGGFYTSEIHPSMPSDVIEITEQEWLSLLAGPANGQKIEADANGNPILVALEPSEPVVLTPVQKLASIGLTVDDLKALLG